MPNRARPGWARWFSARRGLDLAAVGYVESEFFLSGTASAYTSTAPLSSDGMWTAAPIEPAPFTTRVVVRRPNDPAEFSGTVVVEWLNVTAGSTTVPTGATPTSR